MKIRITNLPVFFTLTLSFLFLNNAYSQMVEDGVIDLSTIDWDNSPYIKLEGNWDFYWEQFIESGGVEDSVIGLNRLKAPLPGPWTKIEFKKGTKCPTAGYGTYRLRIKLPNKDQIYALKMYSVFSTYKIFINGKLAFKIGRTGQSKEKNYPQFKTKEIPFVVNKKGKQAYQTTEIVVQVSNYHHRRAGLQQPIYLGTLDEVIKQTKNNVIIGIFLIGIILIIGFNHVLMYLLRRLDFGNLIFGVLSMIMILRNLTTGERLILHWFPDMSWEMLVRLDNFSGFATICFFAFYFFFSFRKEFPKTIFYILMSIGGVITILVFGSTAWFYGQFRLIFEAYIGLGGFYLVFGVLLVAAIKKRPGAFVTFIGMFLLYATAINDVLSSMGVINSAFIAPYGIAAFMILQSFLLTKKAALALKNNLVLSKELKDEKLKLEERINYRTQELSKQASELEIHKETQEKHNWVNQSLNDLNEIMKTNRDNLNALADALLATLVKKVEANLGALYFLVQEGEEESLKLLAHYGLSAERINGKVDLKEGLIGKCFTTQKAEKLNDLPKGFFDINSGLGNSTPKNVLLYPMIVDNKAIGVLELATFKDLIDTHEEFIAKGISNIAAQLNIVKMNDETKHLLNNYKQYEQELKQKDEEFRQMKEELETLREKE